jgi:hypothetical protein
MARRDRFCTGGGHPLLQPFEKRRCANYNINAIKNFNIAVDLFDFVYLHLQTPHRTRPPDNNGLEQARGPIDS